MITSTSNATIKEIMKLKQKKYREATGYYLVEGTHLVEEALKTKQVECVVSTESKKLDVPVIEVSHEVMKKLAFTKHPQSIMAKCRIQKNRFLQIGKRYLLLDDLQDPGNVGTLIRTALAFGINQVILSPNCVDIYNDKVLRSMQGAHFHISYMYKELDTIIKELKENNVYVIGSALQGGVPIKTIASREKLAYIVGNEGNGMRIENKVLCDALAYIPIQTIESLNVAIAGSIMMYHYMPE